MNPGDLCLITGGAGFIGSNLAATLLEGGERVRVFDNLSTGRLVNLDEFAADIEIVEGDIRDPEALRAAVRGASVVFHEAAIPSVARSVADPTSTHDANATGTLNVLIAARDEGVGRVVFASSSSLYGNAEKLPVSETDLPGPISPYAVSKLTGEHYFAAFFKAYDLPTVALRYFNVFGPRQDPKSEYAAVVPKFIAASLEGKAATIYGDGEQLRDFTYIGDVVAANLLAAEADETALGRAFNIAGGSPHTVNELLKTIQSFCPGEPADAAHEPPRVGDVRASHADISSARDVLGYSPSKSFEEGLAATVKWFSNRKAEGKQS